MRFNVAAVLVALTALAVAKPGANVLVARQVGDPCSDAFDGFRDCICNVILNPLLALQCFNVLTGTLRGIEMREKWKKKRSRRLRRKRRKMRARSITSPPHATNAQVKPRYVVCTSFQSFFKLVNRFILPAVREPVPCCPSPEEHAT
ncbi:hypothetical protein AURDEDRAFT_174384 [Auricularia subglabra TFB-10046 SS5]|uniref:60S ribosomal protein L41 n=1 Tax=Auricularia subglabra (strain TFB-10046 / SS5) TaxID=717982 RepID=J0D9N8_AURST|nr:hypothetical protein AURDEDRAFT_174384 [Auricularia subglabra TFB-10046 SS5]